MRRRLHHSSSWLLRREGIQHSIHAARPNSDVSYKGGIYIYTLRALQSPRDCIPEKGFFFSFGFPSKSEKVALVRSEEGSKKTVKAFVSKGEGGRRRDRILPIEPFLCKFTGATDQKPSFHLKGFF